MAALQVVLSPTLPGDYLIKDQGWTDEAVTISLSTTTGAKWAHILEEGSTVDVKVISVDTGGGPVTMPGGETGVGGPGAPRIHARVLRRQRVDGQQHAGARTRAA